MFADDARPKDAVKTAPEFFQLQFFQLSLPQGSISTNEAFWKPFDETFLGFTQHEVLDRTGFRVGRAPVRELDQLVSKLADSEHKDQDLLGAGGKVELEMRHGVQFQTLFTFNASSGHYEGRDYDRADNIYVITFRQTPRQPDHVRVTLAPMVRSQRTEIRIVGDEDPEVKWVQDAVNFDLGLDCDLGADECIVVSPSAVALTNKLVVGRAFMMEERPAQMLEKVIVIKLRVPGTLEQKRLHAIG